MFQTSEARIVLCFRCPLWQACQLGKRKDPEQLRKFRSAIAKLKRAGLVRPEIDARGVQPSRSLKAAVAKFGDVVRGNAKALKLSRVNLREPEAKRRGFQLSKPIGLPSRIIVRHFPGEKVTTRSGNIVYSSAEGIRRLELPPVRTDTFGHFFSDLKKSKTKLPDRIKGEVFGARFYTGRTRTYDSLHSLLNDLNTYETVVRAHGRKSTEEVIRNIEILTIPKGDRGLWEIEREKDKAAIRERRDKREAGRKKGRGRKRGH